MEEQNTSAAYHSKAAAVLYFEVLRRCQYTTIVVLRVLRIPYARESGELLSFRRLRTDGTSFLFGDASANY